MCSVPGDSAADLCSLLADALPPQLLARLLKSNNSEDLQAANCLIKSMVQEVGAPEVRTCVCSQAEGEGVGNSIFDREASVVNPHSAVILLVSKGPARGGRGSSQ